MADTDPFGRDKGEDPLAEMGWTAGETAAAETRPTEVAAPEQPDAAVRRQSRRLPDAPAGIPGKRRRSTSGCASAVVVLGFVIAVFAIGVPTALEAIDEADTEQSDPPRGSGIPADPARRGDPDRPEREREREPVAPRGLERTSMLRRGNLAPALRRLRRITRSDRVDLIRIDAQQVLVTVELRGNRTRLAQATWDGEAEVLSTSAGGGGTSFAWSQVDASAPARIVRAATRGRSSRAFDYLVLIDAAGLRWSAFLKGGGTFSAPPDGSEVSRVG